MKMKKSIKILLVLLCLTVIVGAFKAIVSAEDSGTEAVTEAVLEENSEEVAELIKEVLIIMAESKTKGEAIDKIMTSNIRPDATYGEVSDLVDSFDEMSLFWDCKSCVIIDLSEGLNYGLDRNWLEWYTNTYFPELPEDCESIDLDEEVASEAIDIGVVNEIIKDSDTLADAIISVASKFGITIEDAEELVEDVVHLGDKYLGETEIWEVIKGDIRANPEKYILIALCFLMFIALVVFIIRWIVHNMSQLRTLKMNVTGLKKSVDGDDSEEGKASSLRALITAKNDEIKVLEEKDAELEKEVINLREEVARLTKEAAGVKKNTESSLNVIQETALQIAQLLCIAMDQGKMPVMSKDARQIWYENSQMKIKAAAGKDKENGDGSKTDETSQKV
jgi:peptidoglycan hydrolase CwlO-like protein